MGREEVKKVSDALIADAKILLKDVQRGTDYYQYTVYDENYNIKPQFLEKDKKELVEKVLNTINNMDSMDRTALFHEVTLVALSSEKEMKQGSDWNSSAGEDRAACVLLHEILYHVKGSNERI